MPFETASYFHRPVLAGNLRHYSDREFQGSFGFSLESRFRCIQRRRASV